jgi:hypothetical protein
MSTLKTITILHPSSAVNNIVNDASGNVAIGNNLTVAGTSTISGNVAVGNNLTVAGTSTISGNETVTGTLAMGSSFKRNRIINGNMLIDQRNAGASTTPAASGYLVDRFAWTGSISSKLTFGQNLNSVTPPSGFTKYLGAQTASATTPGATEFYAEYQIIEGYNIADFGWGTASAKTVTLSFVVYSSLTGTFGGSIYNGAANRCYPFNYSVPAANTWTAISLTVAGDTTGTWATDNTAGAIVMFGLGAGASVSGTAGAWGSTLYRSSTGAVQVVATASAIFYITGVQLEVGTKATPYEMQIYSDQLAQCQRYYQTTIMYVYNTSFPSQPWTYKVSMRTVPTLAGGGSGFSSLLNTTELSQNNQTTTASPTLTANAEL